MEEMSLIIAVGVPYEVEISSTGIPMHEATVEFCMPRNDINYSFPVKMVDDKKFIFTITEAVKSLVNKTHEYKLFVHYGNARFEADSGAFNLVDKKAFEVKMSGDKEAESIADKLRKKAEKTNTPKPDETKAIPIVTKAINVEETKVTQEETITPTIEATKPKPTPVVETTTTLKDAKKAISATKKKKAAPKKAAPKKKPTSTPQVNEEEDPNKKVRDILSSMDKAATPSVKLATPDVTVDTTVEETQKPGKFFEEIENMRKLNEQRRKNKIVKDGIRKTTKKK